MARKNLYCELFGTSVALAALLGSASVQAAALPSGGHFVSGKGVIGKAGKGLSIDQSSTTGIIDWHSFSIGKAKSVDFNNGNGATLNRVTGGNLSTIAGQLHATGSVYLINSAGVLVSGTGKIMTGGNFVASGGNLTNSAFEDDKRRFGLAHAKVINNGTITSGGEAKLVGSSAENTGTISAAHVKLRATDGEALAGGTISANADHGAHILVISDKGATNVTGTLSARNRDGSGGNIETSGHSVSTTGTINAGKGGTWLIDPVNLTVDADAATSIDTSLNAGTNVTLKASKKSASGAGTQSSGAGDIVIDSALAWGGTAKLTLDAYHSVLIDAAVSLTGKGKLAILTDDGGKGGGLAFGAGNVTFAKTSSTLTINGDAYTLVNSISALASDIAGNASGDYALAADYDASGDKNGNGYTSAPVPTTFKGTFEGLGNTIENLKIVNTNAHDKVALFLNIGSTGTIENIGLTDANISGASWAAGLADQNGGTIRNAYVTGTISGASVGGLVDTNSNGAIIDSYTRVDIQGGAGDTGGLAAVNFNSTIDGSYSDSTITATGGSTASIGGLVGAAVDGTITNSYSSGTVAGGDQSFVGGFIGGNDGGAIMNAYSTASATGGKKSNVGGFAGTSGQGDATIGDSYSSGTVTGGKGSNIGGFVGSEMNSGEITASYWDLTSSGITHLNQGAGDVKNDGGLTGLTATQMTKSSNFDWSFGTLGSGDWVIVDRDGSLNNAGKAAGGTLPLLLSEYSTTITNAHQLQLMQLDVTANYTLASDIDASATAGGDVWGAAGFVPIGGNIEEAGYTGTFDGAGHTIDSLFINYNTTTATGTWNGEAGLFGFVDAAGVVENVGVTNASVTTGTRMNTGILVGNLAGTIVNSYSSGTSTTGNADPNVTPTSAGDAGGLVGAAFGNATVNQSHSSATVVAGDSSLAGGLVGGVYGGGTVENSYATGNVTGGNDNRSGVASSAAAGGLIGVIFSDPNQDGAVVQVTNDYATGASSVGFSGAGGGLVAAIFGLANIQQSYATGNVTVGDGDTSTTGFSLGGGLVGFSGVLNGATATIDQSYATGSVSGGQQSIDGGLIGYNQGKITNSLATGAVFAGGVGANFSIGGGFVGYTDIGSSISTSYSTGAATGTAASLGGFSGGTTGSGAAYKNDDWDTTTSGFAAANGVGGVTNLAGVTGLTTKKLKSGLPTGFKAAIWAVDPDINGGLPYLKALQSSF